MKKIIALACLLTVSASFATNISYFQNAEKNCGAIVGIDHDALDAPYKIKTFVDGEFVFGDAGYPSSISAGAIIDQITLVTGGVALKLERENSGDTFEVYQEVKKLFGTKRDRTFCDGMTNVSEEDFMFETRF